MTDMKQEMIYEMEDSVKSFVRYINEELEENESFKQCMDIEKNRIGRSDLYQKYRDHCIQSGINTNYIDTQNQFGRKIKKYYEDKKSGTLKYYQIKICDF
jgi:hypothetical protein